jgi:hypothetical protein
VDVPGQVPEVVPLAQTSIEARVRLMIYFQLITVSIYSLSWNIIELAEIYTHTFFF